MTVTGNRPLRGGPVHDPFAFAEQVSFLNIWDRTWREPQASDRGRRLGRGGLVRRTRAARVAAVTSPIAALPAMAEFGTAMAHLRNVLGDQTYESLARKGETMTTAAMVTYAFDQIDQARAELSAVSK